MAARLRRPHSLCLRKVFFLADTADWSTIEQLNQFGEFCIKTPASKRKLYAGVADSNPVAVLYPHQPAHHTFSSTSMAASAAATASCCGMGAAAGAAISVAARDIASMADGALLVALQL